MTFSSDITKFIRKTQGNGDRFIRDFSFNLIERIIDRTPVKTGFLRNSWSASLDQPSRKTGAPGTGGADLSGIGLVLSQATLKNRIYLTNNANYAKYVEFGTSRMAPRAMVRSTLAEADQIAEETLRRMGV